MLGASTLPLAQRRLRLRRFAVLAPNGHARTSNDVRQITAAKSAVIVSFKL
jgi:hypothetical protein